jgi:hypothetical protein
MPRYTTWIVTMWHFGVDTIQEYTGKEFEVTFEDGISDLYMVYTKRMKDGKIKVRSESQHRPDQEYVDAIVRKLFPDGTWLILEMPTRLMNEKRLVFWSRSYDYFTINTGQCA